MNGARMVIDFVRVMARRQQPAGLPLNRDPQRVTQWIAMVNQAERLHGGDTCSRWCPCHIEL